MSVVKKWLLTVAVKKAIKRVIVVAVAWTTAHGLGDIGVNVNVDVLTASALGGYEIIRNWLKNSKGWSWL